MSDNNKETLTDETGRKYRITKFISYKGDKEYTCYKKYYINNDKAGRPKKTMKEKLQSEIERLKLKTEALNFMLEHIDDQKNVNLAS
jgi:hypothetical protein